MINILRSTASDAGAVRERHPLFLSERYFPRVENYSKLLDRLKEITHLGRAGAVLGWDQQCYMPPGGAEERSEEFAVIGKFTHELFTASETQKLLEGAEAEVTNLSPDADERLTLRMVRRDFDQAVKIPSALVSELAREEGLAHEIWVKARQDSDWKQFAPKLEKLLDLSRQKAEYLGYTDRIYDALLDQYEPGRTSAEVEMVFNDLRPGLVKLVHDIATAPPISDACLRRDFDEEAQKAFSEYVIGRLGYDFTRGRQDKAVHPFCTSFGRNDVRITTRYEKNWLPSSLMGSIHETGHALYEQGFAPGDDGSPLSNSASLGIHESQSRLWENIVGRSRSFWNIFYPELQQRFPGVLDNISLNDFYRAINRVEPSFIRVEADEVTYNLHIMLRFELEQAMMDGSLKVADVPEAWNEKMRSYLGIVPENDAQGCLQDVHWSAALFGYFPTYSLGTILSAQLYEKAIKDNPAITTDLENGAFESLLEWLRTHVHRPGRRYLPAELIERICGEPAQSHSYLNYLNGKFGALYGLS
jgi:carboxypeptidase Taq